MKRRTLLKLAAAAPLAPAVVMAVPSGPVHARGWAILERPDRVHETIIVSGVQIRDDELVVTGDDFVTPVGRWMWYERVDIQGIDVPGPKCHRGIMVQVEVTDPKYAAAVRKGEMSVATGGIVLRLEWDEGQQRASWDAYEKAAQILEDVGL